MSGFKWLAEQLEIAPVQPLPWRASSARIVARKGANARRFDVPDLTIGTYR
jgi:hypothetical protein